MGDVPLCADPQLLPPLVSFCGRSEHLGWHPPRPLPGAAASEALILIFTASNSAANLHHFFHRTLHLEEG